MRAGIAIVILLAIAGCATGEKAKWKRANGTPVDEARLENDQRDCMSIIGVPSPGSRNPMSTTRNQMIDCMRTRGWVRH